MDIKFVFYYGFFFIIFLFMFVELFDNLGLMIGLFKKVGLMDEKGEIKGLDKVFVVDFFVIVVSVVMGFIVMNVYVENVVGIVEGGKMGFKVLVVVILFLVSFLFMLLISIIFFFVIVFILIMVGVFMLIEIKNIFLDEIIDVVFVFCIISLMLLMFSIGEGLVLGFLFYIFVKLLVGRVKEIYWIMYMISVVFIINFVWVV